MSINSVSSVSVNTTAKPQTNKTIEKIKNAIDFNKDGDVKLEGSIIGLGIAGLAALGLALKGKHGQAAQVISEKSSQAAQVITKEGDQAAQVITKEGDQAAQVITKEGSQAAQVIAEEGNQAIEAAAEQGTEAIQTIVTQTPIPGAQAESAINTYKKGMPYTKVKKTATHNLPKNLKTQNKAKLHSELLKNREAEQATRKISQDVTNTVNTATTNQRIANNNITSKTKEGIREQIEINDAATAEARKAADAAKEIADNNPTKTYKRKAIYAENRAVTAENNADKQYDKLRKQNRELTEQKRIRAEHKKQFKAHQTPESKAKLEENAQRTQNNAAIKEDRALLKKPGTQKAIQDIKRQRWSDDKILDAALNKSSKYSKYEQRAAQAIINGEIMF